MKKILLSALLILLIPTLMFVPVYALMVYTVQTGVNDYSNDVIGSWSAFQYYHGSERVVCDEERYLTLTFARDALSVDSTILPPAEEADYSWSGSSFSYDGGAGETTLFVDFDAQGNLKLSTGDGSYVILLRKAA